MRGPGILAARFLPALALAACAGGTPEATPAEAVPAKVIDVPEDLLAIKVSHTLSGDGKTYSIRYYVERHAGDEHVIPVVTIAAGGPERLATVQESAEALALLQAQYRERGDTRARAVREFFRADDIRRDDKLDVRIRIQRRVLEDLEAELSRLRREISAEEAFPSADSEKKLSVWTNEFGLRHKEFRLRRAELAALENERDLRERLIREKHGPPRVQAEVEPRPELLPASKP